MDNKNWITKLAEKNPSPALVAGMLIVIGTLAGLAPILYNENRSLSNRLNTAYSDGMSAGRAASDSAWAPIVKFKNTEMLVKDRKIDTLEKENNGWVERYILFVNATADYKVTQANRTLDEFKAAQQEEKQTRVRTKTIIKRADAAIENLTNQNNEN